MYLDQFRVNSPYGMRGLGFHHGIDIATPMNTPLPSLVDGVVAFEGIIPAAAPGYSNEIICIIQADGYFIVYGHLAGTVINTGQTVEAGQIIAYSGNTGYSTGPHLHIERRNGVKASNRGLSAYPSQDITPQLQAYGKEADKDMTIIVRPISKLKVQLAKPVQMFDFEHGKALWDSGDYMEVTQKAIANGHAYLVPEDRAVKGELFGFKESDVFAKGNKVHDTQFDLTPGVDPAIIDKAKKYDQIKSITG